jgi:anti-sigma factor RsiW
MEMNDHNKIRELLTLAAAGALTPEEEKRVAEHLRSCIACSNEFEAWRSIATDLCRLPSPQPSSRLVQDTLAQAQLKLAHRAEHDFNRRVMIFVVAFAWLLMVASWPLFHFASNGFGSLLGPHLGRTWISFAGFTALAWFAGAVAAVILAVGQRPERRPA